MWIKGKIVDHQRKAFRISISENFLSRIVRFQWILQNRCILESHHEQCMCCISHVGKCKKYTRFEVYKIYKWTIYRQSKILTIGTSKVSTYNRSQDGFFCWLRAGSRLTRCTCRHPCPVEKLCTVARSDPLPEELKW